MIIGSAETHGGLLTVTQDGDRYNIAVADKVRHPQLDAHGVIRALCHYLHGSEYHVMKTMNGSRGTCNTDTTDCPVNSGVSSK